MSRQLVAVEIQERSDHSPWPEVKVASFSFNSCVRVVDIHSNFREIVGDWVMRVRCRNFVFLPRCQFLWPSAPQWFLAQANISRIHPLSDRVTIRYELHLWLYRNNLAFHNIMFLLKISIKCSQHPVNNRHLERQEEKKRIVQFASVTIAVKQKRSRV